MSLTVTVNWQFWHFENGSFVYITKFYFLHSVYQKSIGLYMKNIGSYEFSTFQSCSPVPLNMILLMFLNEFTLQN